MRWGANRVRAPLDRNRVVRSPRPEGRPCFMDANEAQKQAAGIDAHIYISYNTYYKFLNSVRPLPIKKQKRWHDCLVDEHGTRTKLLYKNGNLFNYSVEHRSFVLVLPLEKPKEPEPPILPTSDAPQEPLPRDSIIDARFYN